MAVGTVTLTQLPKKSVNGSVMNVYQIDWTSTAGGAASDLLKIYGYLIKAITVPSATVAPTALYDITLVDSIGLNLDAARSLLIDRSATLTEEVYGLAKNGADVASTPLYLCGDYTFTVANAGSAKAGTCYLFCKDDL